MKEKINDYILKLNNENCFVAYDKKGKTLFCIYKSDNGEYFNNLNPYEKEIINIYNFQKEFRSSIRKNPEYMIISRNEYIDKATEYTYGTIENERTKSNSRFNKLMKVCKENNGKYVKAIDDSKGDSISISEGLFIGAVRSSSTLKDYYVLRCPDKTFVHIVSCDEIDFIESDYDSKDFCRAEIMIRFVNECDKNHEVIIQ